MQAPADSILVVEDEDIARRNLEHILKKEGYAVVATNSGTKALELLRQRDFDLVLTDLKMEKVDGMQVLAKSREIQPYTEVIMITGYATVDSAVAAMKEGAYHYIAKPYKIDEIRQIVRQALMKRRLQLENLELKESLKKAQPVPFIVGKSRAISEVLETIQQISASDTNVLIYGESGTGKELAAKAIHHLSPRSAKRFVAFNCGSFTDELMANELFGHEKGAFTGAVQEKKGLLETADGGTVFLDEIGDMPMSMQVKLLRVIQEKELLRVGGVDPLPVDVRFIAATHRDLQQDVQAGNFRQDLYYRLNVIALRLPPLTERIDDIPLLVNHFLSPKEPRHEKIDRCRRAGSHGSALPLQLAGQCAGVGKYHGKSRGAGKRSDDPGGRPARLHSQPHHRNLPPCAVANTLPGGSGKALYSVGPGKKRGQQNQGRQDYGNRPGLFMAEAEAVRHRMTAPL